MAKTRNSVFSRKSENRALGQSRNVSFAVFGKTDEGVTVFPNRGRETARSGQK